MDNSVQNDLGGLKGSGEPVMHFIGIGEYAPHSEFDLKIANMTPYTAHNTGLNGISGNFGAINVATSSEVELNFTLQTTLGGRAIHPASFSWVFVDLDTNGATGDDGAEELQLWDIAPEENGEANPFVVEGNDDLLIEDVSTADIRSYRVKAKKRGFFCDNPDNIENMTTVTCNGNIVDQQRRAVTFHYRNTGNFKIKMKAHKSARFNEGRNFLFTCLYEWINCVGVDRFAP